MAGGIGGLPSFGPGDAVPPRTQENHVIEAGGVGADLVAGHASGRPMREVPPTERPRERLAMRGPGGLSAAELIAIVWGSGSGCRSAVDLAHDALSRHDGL